MHLSMSTGKYFVEYTKWSGKKETVATLVNWSQKSTGVSRAFLSLEL